MSEKCEYTYSTSDRCWVSGCNQAGTFDNPPLHHWCGPLREGWSHCPWCGSELIVAEEDREV